MALGVVYVLFLFVSAVLAAIVAVLGLLLALIRVTRVVGLVTIAGGAGGALLGGAAAVLLGILLRRTAHADPVLVELWAAAGFGWAGLAAALLSGAVRMVVGLVRSAR